MKVQDLHHRIRELARQKNAVILAHYYQEPAIQEVADFVGDSLDLSRKAMSTSADIIVFAGVHFMAETAKLLNSQKKVLLPDATAGCSLADSCTPEAFEKFLLDYPQHIVVTYINCSAKVKAMSDYVCTSANAEKIIRSLPPDQPIVFAPDKNLGRYLIEKTGRDMILWDGSCVVHEAFSVEKLIKLHWKYPYAKVIAHPESEPHLLKSASFIGSTGKLLEFVQNDPATEYIVATEAGILHEMQKRVPHKHLIAAPVREDNTCACSECAYMKLNTLQKLHDCLLHETPEVQLSGELLMAARQPIRRMLEFS